MPTSYLPVLPFFLLLQTNEKAEALFRTQKLNIGLRVGFMLCTNGGGAQSFLWYLPFFSGTLGSSDFPHHPSSTHSLLATFAIHCVIVMADLKV